MASKTNDFVGTFATSTLADAYIASKGWTVQVGWVFLDSTNVVLRWWDGTSWNNVYPLPVLKNASYPMVAGDNIIEVNSTAAPVDITLPPSATVIRKKYTVKWISGGNTVRVLPNGADVIDYALPSFTLGTLYDSVDFILDRNGTGFIRI